MHYRNDRYTVFAASKGLTDLPNMDRLDSRYLVLPLHTKMKLSDVARVVRVIRSWW